MLTVVFVRLSYLATPDLGDAFAAGQNCGSEQESDRIPVLRELAHCRARRHSHVVSFRGVHRQHSQAC